MTLKLPTGEEVQVKPNYLLSYEKGDVLTPSVVENNTYNPNGRLNVAFLNSRSKPVAMVLWAFDWN